MIEPGAAEGVVIENAVQVGGPAPPRDIAADALRFGKIGAVGPQEQRQGRRAVIGEAVVDFIAAGGHAERGFSAGHAHERLVGCEGGAQIHKPEPRHFRRGGLDAVGIEDGPAQNLQPAADAEDPFAALGVPEDIVRQPAAAQVVEVGDHAFRARKHDHIGVAPFLRTAHRTQADVGFGGERRKVGVIGYVPQHDHGDVQCPRLFFPAVGVSP